MSLGFLTRFDTNRAVELQNMARSLKFGFRIWRDCTTCVVKAKALISCTVTAWLICTFVSANANRQFSHNGAHISMQHVCVCVCDIYLG